MNDTRAFQKMNREQLIEYVAMVDPIIIGAMAYLEAFDDFDASEMTEGLLRDRLLEACRTLRGEMMAAAASKMLGGGG